MARVGLAWDLGAGRGHAVRIAGLVARLHEHGHQTVVLARDLRTTRECLGGDALLLAAPHNDWVPQDTRAPAAWGDVLWTEAGLHDLAQASAIASAWRDQFTQLALDAVIVDAAPLAHLAAATLGLRSVAIGTGFLVPPPGPPWPLFRDWEPVDEASVRTREALLAQRLLAIGAQLGVRGDVFAALAGAAACLFTHAALDHYPVRCDPRYLGALHGTGCAPAWPGGTRRAFVYLHASYPHLDALLQALARRTDLSVLAYFGGARPGRAHDRLQVSARAVDVRQALSSADLVVGHGGNLSVLAAQSGVPSLNLPVQAETFITARRAAALGIGCVVTPYDALDFDRPLATLLDDPAVRARARDFAIHCTQLDDAAILDAVIGAALP